MPNMVLSRDNPLSTVNRWGITDGKRLLRNEDGRIEMFHDRSAAQRHVELFCLYNGGHEKFRAVPVPFTLWGSDATRNMQTLVREALHGDTGGHEWNNAATWAINTTGTVSYIGTTCQEDASHWLALLECMGVKP